MEKKLQLIKDWCFNHKVEIFSGVTEKESNQINWSEEENSLENFLEFLTKIKPKFIILNYDAFDYSILENSVGSAIREMKEYKTNEELKEFKSLNELMKNKDGQLYFIKASFVDNGFMFSYEEFAEWSEKFSEFSEIINEYDGLEELSERKIISNETLKLAKELSNFELFNKAKNKPQREIAASLFFKDKKLNKRVYYNISSIIEYADSISKLEIEDIIE